MNAKKTIEIGVFTGYSLLLTAFSIPHDGTIIAIDVDQEAYNKGLPFIKKAGVENKFNFINSDAHIVLDRLLQDKKNEGAFDYAYVDANKEENKRYHEKILKLIKVGGIIIYDNTLWRGTIMMREENVPKELMFNWKPMTEFNKIIAADDRIQISLASIGDGITICRRLR